MRLIRLISGSVCTLLFLAYVSELPERNSSSFHLAGVLLWGVLAVGLLASALYEDKIEW